MIRNEDIQKAIAREETLDRFYKETKDKTIRVHM